MSKYYKTKYSTANNSTDAYNVGWDIEKYRDIHECEEHWQLRKAFMEKWKNNFPEERLVCLARVYTNIEFMGCRYPAPVMEQIAALSFEDGQKYKDKKKTKLQRTFVSASTAAEDRARGIKRVGGEIVTDDTPKSSRIAFVAQGQTPAPVEVDSDEEGNKNQALDEETETKNNKINTEDQDTSAKTEDQDTSAKTEDQDTSAKTEDQETSNEKKILDFAEDYMKELTSIKCLDARLFREDMFMTSFGRLVLLIRPWARKIWNIQTSCQVCGLTLTNGYENKVYSLCINKNLLAEATGETKVEAKNAAEIIAWERLLREVVSVFIKEQFIAQGDARISLGDVTGKKKEDQFGTPVENTVAMKMMKMMGWQGGGLGVDGRGISEPIKPNLQMVNRAGLGSSKDIRVLRRVAQNIMHRYIATDTFDLDLVFNSDFSKDERAALHQVAQKTGLASRSYGEGQERFLVVKKKLNPFSLVKAVIEKGGTTPKYQVFLPKR